MRVIFLVKKNNIGGLKSEVITENWKEKWILSFQGHPKGMNQCWELRSNMIGIKEDQLTCLCNFSLHHHNSES